MRGGHCDKWERKASLFPSFFLLNLCFVFNLSTVLNLTIEFSDLNKDFYFILHRCIVKEQAFFVKECKKMCNLSKCKST